MSLTVGKQSSIADQEVQRMAGLIESDRKNDYPEFYKRVEECAQAGISLRTMETFLRQQKCTTFLVARPYNDSNMPGLPCIGVDGHEKSFFVYCAMHAQAAEEIDDYDANFRDLEAAGFLKPIVIN